MHLHTHFAPLIYLLKKRYPRCELERRQRLEGTARPCTSRRPPPLVDDETQPSDLSPIAKVMRASEKKLPSCVVVDKSPKFGTGASEASNELPQATNPEEPHDLEEKNQVLEKGAEEQKQASQKDQVPQKDIKELQADDLFHDECDLTREEQLQMRDGLKNEGQGDSDADEEPVAKRKPGRPPGKAKAQAKAKATVKSKASPKGKAKAKAAAKVKAKATAKAVAKGKAKAKAARATAPETKEPEAGQDGENDEAILATEHAEDSVAEEDPDLEMTGEDDESAGGGKHSDEAPPSKKARKEKNEQEKKKDKMTFARRYEPTSDLTAMKRWQSLKNTYELQVAPKLAKPKSQEDRCLGACFKLCCDNVA